MSPSSDALVVERSIVLPAHLHARPAGQLVQVAAGFGAAIEIRFEGKTASARSILALMSLGATAGTTVTVAATGPDAEAAAAAASDVLESAR